MGDRNLWLGLTIMAAVLLAGMVSLVMPDGSVVINTIQVFSKIATGPDAVPPPDNFQNNWQIEDFQVAGFRINSPGSTVLRILGEPLGRNSGWRGFGPEFGYRFQWETWQYPGMTVTITNGVASDGSRSGPGKVYRIEITAKHVQTFRGVKVGDSLAQVQEAYGESERQGDYYCYPTDQAFFIKFKEQQGKVAAIELGVEYLKS